MKHNTTTEAPDVAIAPMSLDEAEAILREHAESSEWWMIVVDGHGFKQRVEPIIRKHYREAPPDDYFGVALVYGALAFTVVCLRRRRMLANKYRFELSKLGINLTERELLSGGAAICVADFNLAAAWKFAKAIGLAPMGDDLAMGA